VTVNNANLHEKSNTLAAVIIDVVTELRLLPPTIYLFSFTQILITNPPLNTPLFSHSNYSAIFLLISHFNAVMGKLVKFLKLS
jgi:hypothetical protein